jgi:aspartate racemase
VVTSIAGHFCIEEFEAVSPLPVLNLLSAVNHAIEARGLVRLGILGTRTVMASRLYGRVTTAEIIPPAGAELDVVHDAYVNMAVAGVANGAQRAVFDTAIRRMIDDAGAEAIILGGTDLAIVYRDGETPFPLVDCAGIHVDAIVALASR